MKITVTGSIGHISKPLTETLLRQGHTVTVISSNPERKQAIEALGAQAAIGSIEDAGFLTATFKGSDAVYLMEPPVNFFDHSIDLYVYYNNIASTYTKAVQAAGVKRVVHLSSIGAHTDHGVGMLNFHYKVEQIIGQLPADTAITFMRPVGFYYNLFAFIPTIKSQGAIISNYGGDEKEPWVSPFDIAATIANVITQPFEGRKFIYIASDEVSPNEAAAMLGNAIGQPDLKWIKIPDEQLLNILLGVGMNPQAAKGFVDMNASRTNGKLYEDYYRHRPSLGKVKLTDFAKDFANAYSAAKAPAAH